MTKNENEILKFYVALKAVGYSSEQIQNFIDNNTMLFFHVLDKLNEGA